MKKIKKHFGILTVLFSILLVSCLFPSFIWKTSAIENKVQTEGMEILSNVVGLDLAKYNTNSKAYPKESFFGVPQENVEFTLEANASKLNYLCTFTKEKLHILHLIEKNGAPFMTKSTNDVVDIINDFLENYQKYNKNTFYGELSTMLDTVNPNLNSTLTKENIKLEVTISKDSKTFSWSYTINGVDAARKCVAFVFKDDFLNLFIDTWDLYEIGSTDVNLSEEEATDIAIRNARTFSWELADGNKTLRISNFGVTEAIEKDLVFGISLNADNKRNEDLLTLYPMWRIGVGLDKFYPGNVFGIYVDIWADTKEIREVKTATTNVDPKLIPDAKIAAIEESVGTTENELDSINKTQSNSIIAPLLTIPVLLVVSGYVSFWMVREKNSKLSFHWQKFRRNKIDVTLTFCLVSLLLAVQVSFVYAANPMGRATIWGSLAPYKETREIHLQDIACDYIYNKFNDNGYSVTDYQGISSVEANLLPSIDSNEANYPRVATVWFDHGIGYPLDFPGYEDEWHFRIIDSNDANESLADEYSWIFDYEIYEETSRQKTFFAFISTCMSAKLDLINPINQTALGNGTYGANTGGSGEIIGMPYAWTHGASLTTTGYSNPDSGEFCYIGYPWGSPSLDQEVDPNYAGIQYYDWVLDFFKYALDYDMTINQALDHASAECFPPNDFGTTALHLNFTTIWPGSPSYANCTMEVYGNGNLKLYQPLLTVSAGTGGYVDPSGSDRYSYGYQATANAYAYTNYVFSHWTLDGEYYSSNSLAQVSMDEDHTLHAVFSYVIPTYALYISAGTGGTTSPSSGPHYYSSGTPVYVTAYPNAYYDFDHWSLDGNTYYSNPITVTMNNNHYLQPYFTYVPPTYPLTVYAYANGGAIYVPFYLDGYYVGTTMSTYYVTAGTHSVAVPGELPPYLVFDYWVGVSGGTVNVQGSTSIYAYYHFLGK